jgi:hypothetical protein
VVVLYFD